MYFTNVDYMIFTEENSANKSTAMIKERKRLQNKMLKLHEMIYGDVVKLGLSCHENKNHITTKIEPNRFNGKINSWLLVRYGKKPEEIAPYKEFDYGFTKHACIQYGLFDRKGFEISLFLGRKGDYDRLQICKTIAKNRTAIESELKKIKGYGMKWVIGGFEFEIDNNDTAEFCDWLIAHDKDGMESFLSYTYKIDDERLSEENIAKEVLSKITLLNGLYNAMVQRRG